MKIKGNATCDQVHADQTQMALTPNAGSESSVPSPIHLDVMAAVKEVA